MRQDAQGLGTVAQDVGIGMGLATRWGNGIGEGCLAYGVSGLQKGVGLAWAEGRRRGHAHRSNRRSNLSREIQPDAGQGPQPIPENSP